MRMEKFLSALVFVLYFLLSGNCSAGFLGENDPSILVDMKKNPVNYIWTGHVGTGVSSYLDKKSVNVHEYSPPNYVISFRNIYYNVQPNKNSKMVENTSFTICRYKYNFVEKKMYREIIYHDGRIEWQYLNPNDPYLQGTGSGAIFSGEVAFYLAYGISFYGKPVTLHYFEGI